MAKKMVNKLKESFFSIIPIYLLIIITNFTPLISLTAYELLILSVSTVFLILGMALFNLGADVAMTPMGKSIGNSLTKQGNVWILILVLFVFGFLITIAEPDLSVLASQTKAIINSTELLVGIGVGVGAFIIIAVLRNLFKVNLGKLLTYFYMVLFALCIVVVISGNEALIPLAFDSGGVTTGPITVPFLMALGVGISQVLSKKSEKDSSFGFIAMCSVGPIIAVLVLALFSNGAINYELKDYSLPNNFIADYFMNFLVSLKDVGLPLLLVSVFFFICNLIWLHLSKRKLLQLLIGILYAYFGLSLFLAGVETSFLPIGYKIGSEIASYSMYLLIPFGFVIGALTVLAEPAIHVLNKQVEEITNGIVKKKSMLIALTIGVGLSLALSMIRIIYGFSVLYYLIPGYLICLGLTFFVPKIYSAIAFDSGGVASGPLTSSFILPMSIGACVSIAGVDSVVSNGFGIVAMVAMTPLITIELLGLYSIIKDKIKMKSVIKQISASNDDEIIEFGGDKDNGK